MTRDPTFQDKLAKAKALRPYLKFHKQDGTGLVQTTCTECNKSTSRRVDYLIQYDCLCKKGAKISASQATSTSVVQALCSKVGLRLIGQYVNMNTPALVKCRSCGNEYMAFIGNVRKGHGCQKCGSDKHKATVMARYGVPSVMLVPKVQRKRRATCRKNYGVDHALQNKDVYDEMVTSSFGWHRYRLGRRTVHVQGYEPQALDWIRGKGVKPSQIHCGRGADVPTIRYSYEGVRGLKYFPDIWIPHLNRLVEVKSDYTLSFDLKRNLAKRDAAIRAGYDFLFVVMDKNGNRLSNKRVNAILNG